MHCGHQTLLDTKLLVDNLHAEPMMDASYLKLQMRAQAALHAVKMLALHACKVSHLPQICCKGNIRNTHITSILTFASGARQLVVHEAFDTT